MACLACSSTAARIRRHSRRSAGPFLFRSHALEKEFASGATPVDVAARTHPRDDERRRAPLLREQPAARPSAVDAHGNPRRRQGVACALCSAGRPCSRSRMRRRRSASSRSTVSATSRRLRSARRSVSRPATHFPRRQRKIVRQVRARARNRRGTAGTASAATTAAWCSSWGSAKPARRALPSGPRRTAPRGFPETSTKAGADFEQSFMAAAMRGEAEEDHFARSHSLMKRSGHARNPGAPFRPSPTDICRFCGRCCASPDNDDHRALAAQVIAYAADKRAVVDHLPRRCGIRRQRSGTTRCASWRSLRTSAREHPESNLSVPSMPFVDLLNSIPTAAIGTSQRRPCWRRPGAARLARIADLRTRALESSIQTARWRSPGHAYMPFFILGRVAGMTEEAITAALGAQVPGARARRGRNSKCRSAGVPRCSSPVPTCGGADVRGTPHEHSAGLRADQVLQHFSTGLQHSSTPALQHRHLKCRPRSIRHGFARDEIRLDQKLTAFEISAGPPYRPSGAARSTASRSSSLVPRRRENGPGRNGIHQDLIRRELQCEGPGQPHHARLRDVIRNVARVARARRLRRPSP